MSTIVELIDDVLCLVKARLPHRVRVAVPEELREFLMAENHAGRFGGHFAERSLYGLLAVRFWWPGMRKDVRKYCRTCLPCAEYGGAGKRLTPPLRPIPVGGPFHRVAVDVLTLPATSTGNRYAVVFMDYLTKWPEVFATKNHKAETIARLLVTEIICRHGVPEELLSDRGSDFLSSLIKEVCSLTGMRKINTSAYHPQTDGMVERMNRTLIQMISKHSKFYGGEWDQYLNYMLFAYRVRPHSSSGSSPFMLMYGRKARLPTQTALAVPSLATQLDAEDYGSELKKGLGNAWELARQHIGESQEQAKKQYDKKATQEKYQIGDIVMVDYRGNRSPTKLTPKFSGPYRVADVTDTNIRVEPIGGPPSGSLFVHFGRARKAPMELQDHPCVGRQRFKKVFTPKKEAA